jgi:hypothetical protein
LLGEPGQIDDGAPVRAAADLLDAILGITWN